MKPLAAIGIVLAAIMLPVTAAEPLLSLQDFEQWMAANGKEYETEQE